MRTLSDAIILATKAHAGQKDKSGEDYIHHPLRVMERVRMAFLPEGVDREIAMQVAVLHDVLEDTDVTMANLLEADYDAEVVKAVLRLTKLDNEPYLEFVRRALVNPLARVVKWHDIADNSDPIRLFRLDEHTRNRLIKKYKEAKAQF